MTGCSHASLKIFFTVSVADFLMMLFSLGNDRSISSNFPAVVAESMLSVFAFPPIRLALVCNACVSSHCPPMTTMT